MGPMELFVILILALIIFGPGKLPDVGKALGKAIGEFKKASKDFQEDVTNAAAEEVKAATRKPVEPKPEAAKTEAEPQKEEQK